MQLELLLLLHLVVPQPGCYCWCVDVVVARPGPLVDNSQWQRGESIGAPPNTDAAGCHWLRHGGPREAQHRQGFRGIAMGNSNM